MTAAIWAEIKVQQCTYVRMNYSRCRLRYPIVTYQPDIYGIIEGNHNVGFKVRQSENTHVHIDCIFNDFIKFGYLLLATNIVSTSSSERKKIMINNTYYLNNIHNAWGLCSHYYDRSSQNIEYILLNRNLIQRHHFHEGNG